MQDSTSGLALELPDRQLLLIYAYCTCVLTVRLPALIQLLAVQQD